jgi:ABC-type Na+ efflux pump permease subunit
MNAALILGRKEAAELVLSLRGIAWLIATTSALSVFGLLLVGSTELSLLDNAQVVYDMAGITMALGALYDVIVGNDAIGGERERGSLTPLILTPLSTAALMFGKSLGLVAAWLLTFVLAIPYFWAVGSTGQNLGGAILVVAILGSPVVLGFGFLGMGLGARAMNLRASLVFSLIVLMVLGSPLLLGPSLRQSAVGRIFDAVNPFSAAVNAFDAVLVDSESISAQAGRIALTLGWLLLTLGFAFWSVRRLARGGDQ